MYFLKEIKDRVIVDWQDIKAWIATRDDWFYSIEIKKNWNRSLAQNSKYWKILSIWAQELWYSPEELHYYFKFKILWEINWLPSTKELEVGEFSEYLERVINLLAELSIIVE